MLRVGIIGAGHLGKIHISLLKNIDDFKIIGFYDQDPKVSELVKKEFAIEAFANADSLMQQCDAVNIVTPTLFHYEYACQAIKAGKHIFIEKPVTLNAAEAKKLAQLAREAGVTAQAGHVERFNPAFLAAERFVERPVFIDCQRVATYNPRGTDVSVVLDLMIHDIDLVLHISRSNIKKISATGSPVLCDTEDIAEARIEFDNGCVANLRASRIALNNFRKINIFQKENHLSVDLLHKTAVRATVKTNGPKLAPGPGQEEVYASFGNKSMVHEKLEVRPINAIAHELQLFANSINHKKNAAVTMDEAYQAMKVADDILEIIRKK